MSRLAEAAGHTELKSSLIAGLDTLSENQTVVFTKYNRTVLPLDGYVFWVKDTEKLTVKGSLHFSTNTNQEETETVSRNAVIFTSESPVSNLNDVSPSVMYVGEIDGLKFAFNSRGKYYYQADLHHYRGDAIYPVMQSQLIDNIGQLDASNAIVSNSLPIWLGLNRYFTLFPSFLSEANHQPPYATVHIEPSSTEAMQTAPFVDSTSSTWQLVREKVRITMYGVRNNEAWDFLNYVLDYSLNYGAVGFLNSPTIRDDKKAQSEVGVLAQKKVIDMEINYYQTRVQNIARQLIEHATVNLTRGT